MTELIPMKHQAESDGLSRRSFLCSAAMLPIFTTLTGCGGRESYRYKMTIVTDTPQGKIESSSVRQVGIGYNNGPLVSGPRYSYDLIGEAVAIKLPSQLVFALLSRPDSESDYADRYMTEYIFQKLPEIKLGADHDIIPAISDLQKLKPRVVLDRKMWPRLVTFKDFRDPTTIEILNPDGFGPKKSYKIINVFVDITEDPVKLLFKSSSPYKINEDKFNSWIRSLNASDPRYLGPDHFMQGSNNE